MDTERKIVLVDDKPAFRSTIKLLLRKIGGNRITAEFNSGIEFLENLLSVDADIIFMDIEMPGITGIEATRRALQLRPELTIIGLSLYDEPTYIEKLIDAGARGYLLKLGDNFSLIETIIKFPKAEIFYSKEIAPEVVKKPPVKRHIVIVEPSEGTRFILEYTLTNQGYEVYSYPDAEEALKNIKLDNPDLIIADIALSESDGLSYIAKVRNIKEFASAKVILLSVKVDDEIMSRASSLSVCNVLRKPFTAIALTQGVEKALYQAEA